MTNPCLSVEICGDLEQLANQRFGKTTVIPILLTGPRPALDRQAPPTKVLDHLDRLAHEASELAG